MPLLQSQDNRKMLGNNNRMNGGTGKSEMATRKTHDSEMLQSIFTEIQALRGDMKAMEDKFSKDLDEKVTSLNIVQSEISGQLKKVLTEIPELKQDLDNKLSTMTTAQEKLTDQLREEFHLQWQGQTCPISFPRDSERPPKPTKRFSWPGMAQPVVTSAGVKDGVSRGTTTKVQSIQTGLKTSVVERRNSTVAATRCTISSSTSSGWNDIPPTSQSCRSSCCPHPQGMNVIRQPEESTGVVMVPGSKEVTPVSSQSHLYPQFSQAVINAVCTLRQALSSDVLRLRVDSISGNKSLTAMAMIDKNEKVQCSHSGRAIENPHHFADRGIMLPYQSGGPHRAANGVIPSIQYPCRNESNKNLSDKDILSISRKMGDRWFAIGIDCLCFTVEDLNKIKADFSTIEDRIFQMLYKWHRRHQHNNIGTIRKLLEDLAESEDVDLLILDFLKDRLKESDTSE